MASKMTSERIRKDLLKEDHVEILDALYDSIIMGIKQKFIVGR